MEEKVTLHFGTILRNQTKTNSTIFLNSHYISIRRRYLSSSSQQSFLSIQQYYSKFAINNQKKISFQKLNREKAFKGHAFILNLSNAVGKFVKLFNLLELLSLTTSSIF